MPRARLLETLAEEQLTVSDMMDTSTAVRVGSALAAGYIVTGTVVEMTTTLVIFARVINVKTGEVESAAQVVLPRSGEIERLLT